MILVPIKIYLIHTGPAFSDKAHDDRTLTAGHKAKSHFGTPRQDDRSRFGRLIVAAMIDFGCLVCGAFIEMAIGKPAHR